MNLEQLDNPFEQPKGPPSLPHERKREVRTDLEADRRLLLQARKLDEEFARLFANRTGEGALETIEKLEVIETLSDGLEKVGPELALGKLGLNVTERKRYIPNGETSETHVVEGVSKARWGEVSYALREGRAMKIVHTPRPDGSLMEEAVPLAAWQKAERELEQFVAYQLNLVQRSKFIQSVANEYGILPSEVPLQRDRISFRMGLDVGQQTRSEITTSRIDQLCGLNTVPITVLRGEKYGPVSVQQFVEARPIELTDIIYVTKRDGSDPTAKSFIRLACLDYLTQASDRHAGNILFDEKNKIFVGIDNGMTMGLSAERELEYVRKTERGETVVRKTIENAPIDFMLSVPMEIVELVPKWKLDDEAWQTMKDLYDEIVQFMAVASGEVSLDEQKKLSIRSVRGDAAKYLSRLFRFQYQQENIASKELSEFIKRLAYLVRHRRPPPVRDRTDYKPVLQNIEPLIQSPHL
jgi:hypothetical protein